MGFAEGFFAGYGFYGLGFQIGQGLFAFTLMAMVAAVIFLAVSIGYLIYRAYRFHN